VRDWTYWLRWVLVIPGAVLGAVVSMIPPSLLMYLVMSMSDEYWQDHDRYTPYLTNFISPAVFVALGPRIAPERDAAYKRATALALFIICLFVVGAAIVGVVLFAAMGGHKRGFGGGGHGHHGGHTSYRKPA